VVDHQRFERQPASTEAVSEWLQAPRQMWQRCHETVSEGWPPPADDESDGDSGTETWHTCARQVFM